MTHRNLVAFAAAAAVFMSSPGAFALAPSAAKVSAAVSRASQADPALAAALARAADEQAQIPAVKAQSAAPAKAIPTPAEIGMVGEWRKLAGCRSADDGRQNITSTLSVFSDYTAEVVILSYRQADTTCQGQRIGRTVVRYTYAVDGPSAVEQGAFRTTWTIKSVKVTANNGDVWDRTATFGGQVSRNIVKIVDEPGETFYYVSADGDGDGKVQSKPAYALVRP